MREPKTEAIWLDEVSAEFDPAARWDRIRSIAQREGVSVRQIADGLSRAIVLCLAKFSADASAEGGRN